MIVPLGSKKLQKKDLIKSRAKKLLNLQIISVFVSVTYSTIIIYVGLLSDIVLIQEFLRFARNDKLIFLSKREWKTNI